jgi:hypothetical protein
MRKAQIIFLLILIVSLGFLREFLFIEINLRYYQVLYEPDMTIRSEFIAILDPLSAIQIYWFKWVLTGLMATMFYAIGAKTLSVITSQPQWKLFGLVYLVLLGTALLSYGVIWIIFSPLQGYTIARFLLGLAQSPFPLLFMIPALKLKSQTT